MPKVLVIEDDPSLRRMLRFSLRVAGFDITEITNDAEAVQLLASSSPEAVILDLFYRPAVFHSDAQIGDKSVSYSAGPHVISTENPGHRRATFCIGLRWQSRCGLLP